MRREPRPQLLVHVEAILGRAASGSVITDGAHDEKYFVTHFAGTPATGATTFMTLGLSEHALSQPEGTVRQELVLAHYDRFEAMDSAKLLASVASDCLGEHAALLRGELLGPSGPLGSGTKMETLYCSAPTYFPEELAVFEEAGYEPTVFVWLIPVWESEASYVRTYGHERFEELLVAHDPDLLDLARSPIV